MIGSLRPRKAGAPGCGLGRRSRRGVGLPEMNLYTKNGRPLQVSGSKVYSRSGRIVGRIKNDRVFGTDGRYIGTIVRDRLVYRSTHSARISSPFAAANRAGTARANRAASAMWGEEPDIPD